MKTVLAKETSDRTALEFGRNVYFLRQRLNLNIRGFARMTSASAAWISYIERGRRVPSWSLIENFIVFFSKHGIPKEELSQLETVARKLLLTRTFKSMRRQNENGNGNGHEHRNGHSNGNGHHRH